MNLVKNNPVNNKFLNILFEKTKMIFYFPNYTHKF